MRFNERERDLGTNPEMERQLELFKQIRLADTSVEGEEGEKRIIEQLNVTAEESGLNLTSYERRSDGTLIAMYEKIRKINHKFGWEGPETNRNQAS